MSDAWRRLRGAPDPGTEICAAADVPDPGTLGVTLGRFPLLIVRRGGAVRAYVNACPHQYLPLDRRGDRLLSADGTVLRCTNHQAGFDAETGEGIDGFGLGCRLDRVPVIVRGDGRLLVGPTS